MKEHLLTLFVCVTTALTLFLFTAANAASTTPTFHVFDAGDVIFSHPTAQGNFVVSATPYDAFTLAFTNRNLASWEVAAYTQQTKTDSVTTLALPASDRFVFGTYAVVSTDSDVAEVLVFEPQLGIAHRAQPKKTALDDTAVFLISSRDLSGSGGLIIGLNAQNAIIFEIEMP